MSDQANRKTVACPELVEAFRKDVHPDGKAMTVLAERLGLNKKQVSNFFERERRKAGIAPACERRSRGVDETVTAAKPQISSQNQPGSRAAPQSKTPGHTADLSQSSPAASRVVGPIDQTERDWSMAKDDMENAWPVDVHLTRKASDSASSAISQEELATFRAETASAWGLPMIAGHDRSTTKRSKFGLTTSRPRPRPRPHPQQESPTIQFLKNPFPTPTAIQLSYFRDGDSSSLRTRSGLVPERSLDDFALSRLQPLRKRARVWFTKQETGFRVPYYNNGRPMTTSRYDYVYNENQPVPEDRIETPLPSREREGPVVRSTKAVSNPAESGGEDDEGSEYDADELLAARRRDSKRPGAALRTTIACSELRNAFLSNPHPPASVLDELATKLGLGKKQVSNYFVRERKKAGYTIKVRHGLHRRKGSKKGSTTKQGATPKASTPEDSVPASARNTHLRKEANRELEPTLSTSQTSDIERSPLSLNDDEEEIYDEDDVLMPAPDEDQDPGMITEDEYNDPRSASPAAVHSSTLLVEVDMDDAVSVSSDTPMATRDAPLRTAGALHWQPKDMRHVSPGSRERDSLRSTPSDLREDVPELAYDDQHYITIVDNLGRSNAEASDPTRMAPFMSRESGFSSSSANLHGECYDLLATPQLASVALEPSSPRQDAKAFACASPDLQDSALRQGSLVIA